MTAAQHGTVSRYALGCRCDDCKRAKRDWSREYRRAKGVMPHGTPVRLPDGTLCDSQAEAADALGVTQRTIAYHLNTFGDLHRVGSGKRVQSRPKRRGDGVRLLVGKWASKADLARYLGQNERTVRGWFARGDMERLTAALMAVERKSRNPGRSR